MNYLIIVAGPAASGKSTLIPRLCSTLSAFYYKPSKAYLDLAEKQRIPLDQAFIKVKRNDAEIYFQDICKKHPLVIGDQHLAIQYNKDSNLAIVIENGDKLQNTADEEYVPALSKDFIDLLTSSGIEVMIMLLTASAETLYKRANFRVQETGQPLRNKSLDAVMKEINSEKEFFEDLVNATHVSSCIIDTTILNENEVYEEAINEISSLLGI